MGVLFLTALPALLVTRSLAQAAQILRLYAQILYTKVCVSLYVPIQHILQVLPASLAPTIVLHVAHPHTATHVLRTTSSSTTPVLSPVLQIYIQAVKCVSVVLLLACSVLHT